MNKKVIITGAGGQDGSYMSEYLLKNTDYKIIGTIRRTSQPILSNLCNCLSNNRFSLSPMDLTDVHSIMSLIDKEKPDYFINFAASSFVADSWNQPTFTMEANSISLIHILESVKKYVPHCRVYSAGSSEQWGNVIYSPQDENHPMRPRSIYGVSKCAAFYTCKVYRESYGLYVVHGIVANHESPRRQLHFVTRKITTGVANIFNSIVNNKPVVPFSLGNLNAKRDWSDAEDVVDAVWRMLNQEEYILKTFLEKNKSHFRIGGKFIPTDYVVGSGENHSLREFVEKAFELIGFDGEWHGKGIDETYWVYRNKSVDAPTLCAVKVDPKFYRPAEVDILCANSSRIRDELGWTPKTNFEGLIDKMITNDLKKYNNL